MRVTTTLLLHAFEEAVLYRDFLTSLDAGSGAVVTFCGRMRGSGAGGKALDRLVLEHHPERTAESLRDAAEITAEKHGVELLHLVHRAGTVLPGEAIVWVAAAATHRRAAFDAVDELMDRLKTEAVFWKREEGAGGRRWIEPTSDDRADRARWEDDRAGTH